MKQKMNRDQPLRMAGKQERLKADRAEKFSAVRGDNLSSKRRNSADGADFALVRNESLVTRKCRRWRKRVKPRHCCRCWRMSEALLRLKAKAEG